MTPTQYDNFNTDRQRNTILAARTNREHKERLERLSALGARDIETQLEHEKLWHAVLAVFILVAVFVVSVVAYVS